MTSSTFSKDHPVIDQVSFRKTGYITLHLEDERILNIPLAHFPGIAKLTAVQRRQHHIADGIILMFEGDDEIYHIEDFLGSQEHRMSTKSSTESCQIAQKPTTHSRQRRVA
jgi:hypothetical protein